MTDTPLKLNTLIPMQHSGGERCFVNAWDVPARKAEGWQVIGDHRFHEASTRAPVEAVLGQGTPTPNTDGKPAPSIGDAVAAERARIRAITKAADDKQEALADKLIADGVPEADALQALAADREARKQKGKPPAPAATAAADTAPTK